MNVLRKIWRFLVGVKDALALILLLVFFAGVWSLLRGGPPATVPTDAAHEALRAAATYVSGDIGS